MEKRCPRRKRSAAVPIHNEAGVLFSPCTQSRPDVRANFLAGSEAVKVVKSCQSGEDEHEAKTTFSYPPAAFRGFSGAFLVRSQYSGGLTARRPASAADDTRWSRLRLAAPLSGAEIFPKGWVNQFLAALVVFHLWVCISRGWRRGKRRSISWSSSRFAAAVGCSGRGGSFFGLEIHQEKRQSDPYIECFFSLFINHPRLSACQL